MVIILSGRFLMMRMSNDRMVQAQFQKTNVEREPDVIDEKNNPVVIAGYGRFGQIVGRLLLANGFKITVLELDPGQIKMLREFGNKVVYGNVSRRDLLHAAGAEQVHLFVLAIGDSEVTSEKAKNAAVFSKEHDQDSMRTTFEPWGDEEAYMFEVHNQREALHRVLQ